MRQCDERVPERDAEYRKMRAVYDRESAERVRADMLVSAYEDDYQKGLALGLLRLLIRRFGTLHEGALVHLACASIDELQSARDSLCESTDCVAT